ncbi:unnamed protein product [Mucor hiemalis]
MPSFGKKSISEDEESDDMGSTKPINKKVKKRKRSNTKQEEEVEEEDIVAPINNEQQQNEKKKMKKEKKPKPKATPKKKAPLDLDRQCGVLIPPNNNPCTRSLTCKIHAMGAKRAVEGRSHPFNELLAAYQKKGIGRPQVPTSTSTLSTSTATTSTPNEKDNKSLLSTLNREEVEEDIDSDEETESVRIAIEQNKPIPLGSKKVFYVRRKRKYYKLRDILLEAITPKLSATTGTSTELSL